MKLRRPKHLFFVLGDQGAVCVEDFFAGKINMIVSRRLSAISPLVGKEIDIRPELVQLLYNLPPEIWTPAEDVTSRYGVNVDEVEECIAAGILMSDGDRLSSRLLAVDERYDELRWEPYSALFHTMTKWEGHRVPKDAELDRNSQVRSASAFAKSSALFGPPPPHFHDKRRSGNRLDLDLPRQDNALFQLLRRRESARLLDHGREMSMADLSALLFYTFGCHGYHRFTDDFVVLKKTSPSGGALHPIEAFPLIRNVEGLASGLYHYNVEAHALDMVRAIDHQDGDELVMELTAGQSWFASAHALIIMTARFHRHFWKYRRHKKGYRVVLMDAAHLSQTAYLVCTELGLGVCFSACVNDKEIERLLDLDVVAEGVVGVLGVGVRRQEGYEFTLENEPYVPRTDRI